MCRPAVWFASFLVFVLVVVVEAASAASAVTPGPPLFRLVPLGFDDAEHTAAFGRQRSSVQNGNQQFPGATPAGIFGISDRYRGDNQNGISGWFYDRERDQTTRVGLLGDDYFAAVTDRHRTLPQRINPSGQVAGVTEVDSRVGGSADHAWLFDPATGESKPVGYSTLTDPFADDLITFLSDDGYVTGQSRGVAWLYDPTIDSTRVIGPASDVDIGAGSSPISNDVVEMLAGNRFVGVARKDNPNESRAVWLHDAVANTTAIIGFNDADHEFANGVRRTEYLDSTDSGMVIGRSNLKDGFSSAQDVWVYDVDTGETRSVGAASVATRAIWTDEYDGATESGLIYGTSISSTIELPWVYDRDTQTQTFPGLRDATHMVGGGFRGEIVDATESGFVAGRSQRIGTSIRASFNRTPWVYNAETDELYETGLTSGDFQAADGAVWNSIDQINEAGQAIGGATEFDGAPFIIKGRRNWFFDPESQETIDLIRPLIDQRGALNTGALSLNENGQVVGVAGAQITGEDWVWFYDHESQQTHVDFELPYTDVPDPFQRTDPEIELLTDSGLVLGSTVPFGSNSFRKWLFDSQTGVTHDLTFSRRQSDGDAFTQVDYLSDDGVAIGRYDLYDGEALLGRRWFYWSLNHGFHDLESLIVDDLSELGWETLFEPSGFNPPIGVITEEFIYAYGVRLSGNALPFALVPIPEPATVAICFVTLGFFRVRQR